MRILYIITKYLTFPGAFLRAFWEHFTCKLLGLPVEDPAYLRANEMCGHIDHALAKKGNAAFAVAFIPGLINFLTGFPIFLAGIVNLAVMELGASDSISLFIISIAATYVGASLLCSLFPPIETVMNLWDVVFAEKKSNIIGRIAAFIPTILMYAGAYIEKYCVSFVIVAVLTILMFVK